VNAVFADASAWIASANAREEHHQEARETRSALLDGGATLLTTNLVLAEVHALISRARGAAPGLELLDVVYADPQYAVVHVGRDLESAAVDRWLRVFRDRPFSLCDAISFEVMRREGIREAFTLDHHFAVAGFTMLPAPRRAKRRR
jgi:predicted nucleic acid-binding protein